MGIHIHLGNGHRGPRRRYHHRTHSSAPLGRGFLTILGIIFLVSGIFCLWFYFNARNDVKAKDYVTTTGYVYGYEKKWDNDDYRYLYAIVVEYTVGGEKYYVTSNSYSSNPKSRGVEIEVKYNPQLPSESVISSKDNGDWLVLLVGIVFPLASILLFTKAVKMPSNKKYIENNNDINEEDVQ